MPREDSSVCQWSRSDQLAAVRAESQLISSQAMGKEVAIHSSILAWRIPWTEDPGGLQFMGSQRVRYN